MKEYKLKINSNDYHVVVSGLSNGRADVMVNGQSYSVEIADAGAASDAGPLRPSPQRRLLPPLSRPPEARSKARCRASCSTFRSPSATASARASG